MTRYKCLLLLAPEVESNSDTPFLFLLLHNLVKTSQEKGMHRVTWQSRKINIFDPQQILITVHVPYHWILVQVSSINNEIILQLYDSLYKDNATSPYLRVLNDSLYKDNAASPYLRVLNHNGKMLGHCSPSKQEQNLHAQRL